MPAGTTREVHASLLEVRPFWFLGRKGQSRCHKISGPAGGEGKGDFLQSKCHCSFSWAAGTRPGGSGELRAPRVKCPQRLGLTRTGWLLQEQPAAPADWHCSEKHRLLHQRTSADSKCSAGERRTSVLPNEFILGPRTGLLSRQSLQSHCGHHLVQPPQAFVVCLRPPQC